MINLKDTTFIIPVYVESEDRYNNAISVLGFLNHYFDTNIIIHELILNESKLDFLGGLKNLNIKHITENFKNGVFHRTRQLNEMLNIVDTRVVVNYDIDVLLPVDSYIESQKLILDSTYDVVYPYKESKTGQVRILQTLNRTTFNKDFDLNLISSNDYNLWSSKCGHCMFLNTEKYVSCGGENENFISYGPEDSERYERFNNIDYNVGRIDDVVFHFEHSRTENSDNNNEFFNHNVNLYDELSKFSKDEIIKYYSNIDYKNKYSRFIQ